MPIAVQKATHRKPPRKNWRKSKPNNARRKHKRKLRWKPIAAQGNWKTKNKSKRRRQPQMSKDASGNSRLKWNNNGVNRTRKPKSNACLMNEPKPEMPPKKKPQRNRRPRPVRRPVKSNQPLRSQASNRRHNSNGSKSSGRLELAPASWSAAPLMPLSNFAPN